MNPRHFASSFLPGIRGSRKVRRHVCARTRAGLDDGAGASNAGGDVDRQAGEIVADALALPGMDADPELEIKLSHRLVELLGATDRRPGTREHQHRAVAGSRDHPPAVLLDELCDGEVALDHKLTSRFIPDPGGEDRRADNVLEHHRGEHPI
jgi:hypothetical protein